MAYIGGKFLLDAYDHYYEMNSLPNLSLAGLTQVVKQYSVHILSLVTDNCPT